LLAGAAARRPDPHRAVLPPPLLDAHRHSLCSQTPHPPRIPQQFRDLNQEAADQPVVFRGILVEVLPIGAQAAAAGSHDPALEAALYGRFLVVAEVDPLAVAQMAQEILKIAVAAARLRLERAA